MAESSVGLVPEATGGPRARVFRTTVAGVPVDTQAVKVLGVIASNGELLDVDSLAKTYVYNGDATINYVQVVSGTVTYRKTYTYSGGNMTGVSGWVAQ